MKDFPVYEDDTNTISVTDKGDPYLREQCRVEKAQLEATLRFLEDKYGPDCNYYVDDTLVSYNNEEGERTWKLW